MTDFSDSDAIDGIAILSMAGRFPGAGSPEELWRKLREGGEGISLFSDEELLAAGVSPELLADPKYVKARGVLDGVEMFDAAFFSFSPREAELMDPQHRLFLECAWEALERAGYDPERTGGPVGVYGGMTASSYLLNNLYSNPDLIASLGGYQTGLGTDKDFVTTRVSYKLNLKGPSIDVQTACSTSLVAVALACQGLLSYQCDLALAGGSSVRVPQIQGYLYQEGGPDSSDGRCRAFAAGADGSVYGSGVGVVLLKRLEDALADGDPIEAVILGSAINNDGSDKVGFTAPSVEGQSGVITTALALAGISPASVGYVEAHGTGTALGDPIEITALTKAFQADGDQLPPGSCAIGSIKPNIGHLSAAAGVASLIKAVLALKHQQIPPNLNFDRPNPEIDFAQTPFCVNTELRSWPRGREPRRAGVSSLGMGGTNAHVVLEEAPEPAPSGPSRAWQLLVLAARTESALETTTDRLAADLAAHPDRDLADVAYTLAVGRHAFAHRRVLVARDPEQARRILADREPRGLFTHRPKAAKPSVRRGVAFLLSGVGDHYVQMARDLYDREETFRDRVDHAAEILLPELGRDLRQVLYPAKAAKPPASDGPDLRRMLKRTPVDPEKAADEPLHRTSVVQPVLFVVEYALAQLWMEWGIRPEALIGYSLGEYVAACLAGVLSLADALLLVTRRAQMIEALPAGGMLAVPLPRQEVEPLLGSEADLAAVNGPNLSVAAGPPEAITRLEARLSEDGVPCRRLPTRHAFHSRMMRPIAQRLTELASRTRLQPPSTPVLSNVTGTWLTSAEATDPEYWGRHLCGTVELASGLETLWQSSDRVLLEVGPGQGLTSLALQMAPPAREETEAAEGSEAEPQVSSPRALPSLPSQFEDQDDQAFLLTALGKLWLAGVEVDWRGFYGRQKRRRVVLPTYPFERQRYWIEPGSGLEAFALEAPAEPVAERPEAPPAAVEGGHARPELTSPYAAPTSDAEQRLAEMFQEILGIDSVGIHDSFFELGGHSLQGMQLIHRVQQAFDVTLSLQNLFAGPTVAEMARSLARDQGQGDGAGLARALELFKPAPGQRHEPFPLTDVQEAYWIGRSDLFELGSIATHSYFETNIIGLDVARLNRAWRTLIDRHDMLRAVVDSDGWQRILPEVPPYEIEVLDLRGRDDREADAALEAVRESMSHQVLPSDQWPLFEIRASLLDADRARLHVSLDLLIGDALSFEILGRELLELYRDPQAELPALEISFRDCVLAEAALRETEVYQRDRAYWMKRLPTLPPAPELTLAKDPSAVSQPHFERRQATLPPALWSRLSERAAQAGLTPTGVLLTAFSEILGYWAKKPHFAINLTLFNRLPFHPQVDHLVGDFTSLTLLEIDHAAPGSFEGRARRLQERLWEDLDHRLFSGVRVMRELGRRQAAGDHHPLMPVVFTSTLGQVRDTPAEDLVPEETGEERGFSITQTPQVWLDHQVSEVGGALFYNWDVVDELFPEGLVDAMFSAYGHLLQRLIDSDEVWREEGLSLLPQDQLDARTAYNATRGPEPQGLLHGPFLAQAEREPGRTAVIAADRSLSYGELLASSSRLARQLRQTGARPGQLVAVVMEKGWEQVVAVMAILQAGSAYLPIDPALPQERRDYLLEFGQVTTALTTPQLMESLESSAEVRRIAVDASLLEGPPDALLEPVQEPRDLAYVIFTSGSTGLPKGVEIDHRGALNTVVDVNERYAVGAEDRVLTISNLNFDLSVYDIFGPLAVGGAVVVPDPRKRREPSHWAELLVRHRVSVWNTVPALMEMLVEYTEGRPEIEVGSSLRLVMMSGDWIPVTLPGRIEALFNSDGNGDRRSRPLQVVSLGGATEASIWSIFFPIEEDVSGRASVPYGRPMRNQTFFVLDQALEPRPDWVPGQLYIGGIGLARGYWRDAEKTAASFITHPRTGERLYRTGDLGRFLPDGNIEFLGREDFQVKIQGHRIELGEIEAALLRHAAVRSAVVSAVGPDRHNKRLVAYVVEEPVAKPIVETVAETAEQPPEPPPLPARREMPQSDVAADLGDAAADEAAGAPGQFEKLQLKLSQPGLRREPGRMSLALEHGGRTAEMEELWRWRRSYRAFDPRPVAREELSRLLSSLRQLDLEDFEFPKYRYASAGNLYPVQAYLYVKPGRVDGLAAGTYYYDPREHCLVELDPSAVIDARLLHPVNHAIFAGSAFSLLLIAQMAAITPVYGEQARDFCLLEAGYMSQLLMAEAPACSLGLCPIGTYEFDRFRHHFALDDTHLLVHGLEGGAIANGRGTLPRALAAGLPARPETPGQMDPERTRELRRFLADKLPEYMVPSTFVSLAEIPLTANGKVDRQALPEPESAEPVAAPAVSPGVSYAPPGSDLERGLVAIWQEVLGVDQVGLHDSFFELGGNSVQLVRAYNKLRVLIGRDVPLMDLFQHPTVSALAGYLARGPEAEAAPEDEEPQRDAARRAAARSRSELRRRHRQQEEEEGDSDEW